MYARYVSSEVKILQSVLTILFIQRLVWRRLMLAGVILEISVSTADTDRLDGQTRRRYRTSPILFLVTGRRAAHFCALVS